MKAENPVDKLFEKVVGPLFSNPQYKEILEKGQYSTIFSLFFRELVELVNLHTLFIENYVPTAIKVVEDTQGQISVSKYSRFYKNPGSFGGIIDEIVRVGYVKLYHRWENFQEELVTELSTKFNSLLDFEKINFEQFVLKYYKLKISNPYSYTFLRKINWISNCEKHYNGFPRKKDPPASFRDADKGKRLKIAYGALSADILEMIRFDCNLTMALTCAGQSRYLYTLGAWSDELTSDQKHAMLSATSTVAGMAFGIIKELQSDSSAL